MSPDSVTNVWALAALALTTIGGVITAYFASRSSKEAGHVAERADDNTSVVEGWHKLVESYNRRLSSLETSYEVQEAEVEVLKLGKDEQDRTIAKLVRDLDAVHSWKRAAIRYLRDLRAWGAHHIPDREMPAPPPELHEDLEG